MLTRRTLIGAAVALPFLSRQAMAAEPPVFAKRGLAIRGYDPVAYFAGNGPVDGSADFSLEWMNATWRFANADNRAKFEMNPAGFAPKYGGYCAYAAASGYLADTDPAAWTVVDGKLYLNYSIRVRSLWEQDIPGFIAKADANWPAILNG